MGTQEQSPKIVIGLTGPLSGGKGSVADYFKSQGFFITSLSDRIREEITKRGEVITREKLQDVADELRQSEGPEVLAKRTWEIVLLRPEKGTVIDSIRGEAEVEYLKKQPNFHLIGVTSPPKLRYERMIVRTREGEEKMSWEEFVRLDNKDFKSGEGKIGRNIEKCLSQADYLLENTGNQEELLQKVKIVMQKIEGGKTVK